MVVAVVFLVMAVVAAVVEVVEAIVVVMVIAVVVVMWRGSKRLVVVVDRFAVVAHDVEWENFCRCLLLDQ